MRQKYIPYLILFLHLIFLLLYLLFGNIGHYGYDDMLYAKVANDLLSGDLDFNEHFTYRFPIVILTALSYSLFGINDFASSLPTIIISVSVLYIVFLLLRNKGLIALSVGLSLTLLSNWFIFYSGKLMPDNYISLSVMLTLYFIAKYKYLAEHRRPALTGFLIAVSLFFGFTTKGNIVLIFPLLVYLFVVDILKKRDQALWLYTIGFGVLLLGIYFVTLKFITGEYFSRFDAIARNSYLNFCSYDKQSFVILLKRIGYEFYNMMVFQGHFTGFIFIIPIFLRKNGLKFYCFNDSFSFFMISSLLLLLSANFMTISLNSYIPMCLDPRHFLYLTPLTAIPAALIITDFVESKKAGIPIIISCLLVALWSYYLPGNNFTKLYFPLLLLFSIFILAPSFKWRKIVFLISLTWILALIPYKMIRYAQKIQYPKQKRIAYNHLINTSNSCYIITNEVQKRLLNYYNEFENNEKSFLSYDKFDYDTLDNNEILLFQNRYTRNLSGYDEKELPLYVKLIDEHNELIFADKDLGISLNKLNNEPILTEFELIHQSLNGFNGIDLSGWNFESGDLSSEPSYDGSNSIFLGVNPPKYSVELDSLISNNEADLLIKCELFGYFLDHSDVSLVIALEDNEKEYFVKTRRIKKYIKAYSSWWPVEYSAVLKSNELRAKSRVKLYFNDIDSMIVFIDEVKLSIYLRNR